MHIVKRRCCKQVGHLSLYTASHLPIGTDSYFHFIVLVASIIFILAPTPLQPASEPQDESRLREAIDADRLKEIDGFLKSTYHPNDPGAVISISLNGRLIYRHAYGLANLEWNVPLEVDAVFPVGSLTKHLTATAILTMIQDGKISLHDTLERFFPFLSNGLKNITVENLLNHTSGITNCRLIDRPRRYFWEDMQPSQAISSILYQPLKFEPETDWVYSDAGYFLLGNIIEKVSGMGYFKSMNKMINRVGMKRSFWGDGDHIVQHSASGYIQSDNSLVRSPHIDIKSAYSAGALLSTVDDLFLWYTLLMNGDILSNEMLARSFVRTQLKDGQTINYGYGWAINKLMGIDIVEHGGNISGFSSHVLYVDEHDLLVLVLTNCEGKQTGPGFVGTKIALMFLGEEPEEHYISLPESVSLRYVGVYKVGEDDLVCVGYEKGNLYYTRNGGTRRKMLAISEIDFAFEESYSSVRFLMEGESVVKEMVLKNRYIGEERAGIDELESKRRIVGTSCR